MRIVPASDSSLLVVLGDSLDPATSALVLDLFHRLYRLSEPRIRNLHPGYTTLLVDFDPLAVSHHEVEELVRSVAATPSVSAADEAKVVQIPVCYGGEFGPDLVDVSSHTGLSPEEVVRRHSAGDYRVAFLGFTAGFSYLAGMTAELSTPRLSTPRRAVHAGSVGIAGQQTGIYPTATPGGWRLIGRTPLRMFDPMRNQPSLLAPGDSVRFVAIDQHEFDRLARLEA